MSATFPPGITMNFNSRKTVRNNLLSFMITILSTQLMNFIFTNSLTFLHCSIGSKGPSLVLEQAETCILSPALLVIYPIAFILGSESYFVNKICIVRCGILLCIGVIRITDVRVY